MLGYVYVMSNEAMPGLYKIGCTSRNPSERANDLYTTGVPAPFVVEYCIYIDGYDRIEKLVHKNLIAHNINKEFFKCDLVKCIQGIKYVVGDMSQYDEEYRDQRIRARVEGREAQYLRELEERRCRAQLAQIERERRERQEAAEARVFIEQCEKERREQDRLRKERENKGCLVLGASVFIGFYIAGEEHSLWPLIISVIIGFVITYNIDNNYSNK